MSRWPRLPKSIVSIFMLLFSVSVTSGNTPLFDRWNSIVEIYERELALPSSLQMQYTIHRQDLKGGEVNFDMTYNINYLREGNKFYSYADIKRIQGGKGVYVKGQLLSLDKPMQRVDERAYDGGFLHIRERDDLVFMSQKADRIPPVAPLPWRRLNIIMPEKIRELIEEGRFRVASTKDVTFEGRNVIQVIFEYTDTGTPFLEVFYDPKAGYLPILSKKYSREGDLSAEVSNVEVMTIEAGDNIYYLPVKGVQKKYGKDKFVSICNFEIHPDSIVLDKDIEDKRFGLELKGNDRIYDLDIKQLIWDPASPEGLEYTLARISRMKTTVYV